MIMYLYSWGIKSGLVHQPHLFISLHIFSAICSLTIQCIKIQCGVKLHSISNKCHSVLHASWIQDCTWLDHMTLRWHMVRNSVLTAFTCMPVRSAVGGATAFGEAGCEFRSWQLCHWFIYQATVFSDTQAVGRESSGFLTTEV